MFFVKVIAGQGDQGGGGEAEDVVWDDGRPDVAVIGKAAHGEPGGEGVEDEAVVDVHAVAVDAEEAEPALGHETVEAPAGAEGQEQERGPGEGDE